MFKLILWDKNLIIYKNSAHLNQQIIIHNYDDI